MPIDLKGKQYVTVNERISAFREEHPNYGMVSEILSNDESGVTFVATISDETGRVLATGHAHEKEGSSFINKTSHIENCETSAWGRALGNLGYGIDTGIASAEEVANAQLQQKQTEKRDTIDKREAEFEKQDELLSEYRAKVRKLLGDAAADAQAYFLKKHRMNIYDATEADLKKAIASVDKKLAEADPTT